MTYEKTIILPHGKTCHLRHTLAEDAAAMLALLKAVDGQTDNMLCYPDEVKYTIEEEEAFLQGRTDSPRAAEIAAFVEGQLVATAGFEGVGSFCKVAHRAEFGICVHRDYWRQGIGRALTQACIDCARQAGYRRLELDVVAENTGAQALYKACGFVEYGRNPCGFVTRDGRVQALVLMGMEL